MRPSTGRRPDGLHLSPIRYYNSTVQFFALYSINLTFSLQQTIVFDFEASCAFLEHYQCLEFDMMFNYKKWQLAPHCHLRTLVPPVVLGFNHEASSVDQYVNG